MKIMAYLFCFLLFIVIDSLWINLFVKDFYLHQVSDILLVEDGKISARILPAIIFYALFVSILYYFTVFSASSLKDSAIKGSLYGLATYATFTLTNYAVMKSWSLSLVLTDLLWGSFLCMIVATSTKKMISIRYKPKPL